MKKLLWLWLAIPVYSMAMDLRHEALQAVQIGLGGAAVAYVYDRTTEWLSNKVNEQDNAHLNRVKPWEWICVEKRGILGSPWMGLLLLAASRNGPRALEASELIKPVIVTYGATSALSLVVGATASYRKRDTIGAVTEVAFCMGMFAPAALCGYILYKRM